MTSPAIRPFRHLGFSGDICALALKNLALSVVTLSIWRFWGRTLVRRALWGKTTAWGDPLEYVGTGAELFKGFLLALVLVYLPLVAGFIWAQTLIEAENPLGGFLILVLYLLAALLIAAGSYRARRYQLCRTLWRGIRGGQTGSAWAYAARSLLVWVLIPLSLGWAAPWGEMWLARYRMANTTFGDRAFTCDARAGNLYGRYALVWVSALLLLGGLSLGIAGIAAQGMDEEEAAPLIGGLIILCLPLAVVMVGLPLAWYRQGVMVALAAGTGFDGCRFKAEIGYWAMVRLAIGNALISAMSMGVLRPWAALRIFRFGCAVLSVEGVPDFAAVHQGQDSGPGMGEGVVSVLDGVGEF
ncbi:hypothetical protein A6A04_14315 [Paramagnetospirillum marisnigri]|uniref:DUF898 domain-containing protein n=1 Tax=Paramagnetospirillum marisnigri TaxID=1285242 RepID=A0A178MTI9_9PROT|nr:YjgN family protein [Paramagnetospirillum marisnigri]OAN53132.1 hypothetical protein A6A04_14315 [Paramagnetospirillum marisnigri]